MLVLICGHGGRDARCGILGPVLMKEFEGGLPRAGVEVLDGPVPLATPSKHPREAITGPGASQTGEESGMNARLGLISHIGGHIFAGNVILYIPPSARLKGGEPHPLRGMGIWYGRVEPKHVEGIIAETLGEGRVVMDLFRGGVEKGKGVLRL